jgi:hypothetical protein
MTLFLSTTLAVAGAALIWALGAFDRLIDVGSVELDGRGTGERKVVAGEIPMAPVPFLQSRLARNRLFVKWLFHAPKWASQDRVARSLLRRFRVGSVIAFAGFVVFVASAFLGI